MDTRAKLVSFIFSSLALIFFSYDCLASDIETLRPSAAITEDFKQSKMNKEYNYYYGGSDTYPTIIFALKKNYLLEGVDDLWRKLDVTSEQLAYLVANMQMRGIECCGERPQGFDLFDNSGKKIGIWYSITAFAVAPVTIKENNKVAIYPPRDTATLKSYEKRSNR